MASRATSYRDRNRGIAGPLGSNASGGDQDAFAGVRGLEDQMTGVRLSARVARAMVAVVMASVMLPLLAAGTAEAATTITVTESFDIVNPSDGVLSLREAVTQANATVGDVVIQFATPSNSVSLSCDGAGDENLNVSGDLDYTAAGALSIQNATTIYVSIARNCAVNDDRVLDIRAGAPLSITNVNFQGGRAGSNGGAIRSGGAVTATDAKFENNQAVGRGGAIAALTATLTNTTFVDNVATIDGGGVWTLGGQTIVGSTFKTNTALNGGGAYAGGTITGSKVLAQSNTASGDGGGLASAAKVDLTNSTITGNTAGAGRKGGGLFVSGGASPSVLTYVTVAGNGAPSGANVATTVGFQATASAIGAVLAGSGPSCDGPVTSLGFNGDEGTSCGFNLASDRSGATLMLGALSPNGGPQWTMRPLTGSPLIDLEPAPCGGAGGGTDQRGMARPQGSGCDAGSYEVNAPITVTTSTDVVNAGDGVLSLREAINVANATMGHDVIQLAPSTTYPIAICGSEQNNVSGSLDPLDPAGLTVTGSSTMIDHTCTGALDAVFRTVSDFTLDGVSLNHSPGHGLTYSGFVVNPVITLKNAQVLNSGADGVALGSSVNLVMRNAAIKNSVGQGISSSSGLLDMVDSEITGSKNLAFPLMVAGAGEVMSAIVTNSSIHDNPGGGLWVHGSLNATNSHFDNNSGGIPAVFAGSIVAVDSTFDNNSGTKLGAGGLFSQGSASLTRVSVSGNSATFSGGAIFANGPSPAAPMVVTITDSHIDNNTMTGSPAPTSAGGIYLDGNAGDSLSITGSTVNGNTAPGWGAIYTDRALTLTNSTVSGNTSTTMPAGSLNEATVFVYNAAATVTGSTISGNTAPTATSFGTGGLFVYGPTTIERSTVTGNTGRFGGVVLTGGGAIVDSTIVGNTSSASGVANLTLDGSTPFVVGRSVLATLLGSTANCYFFTAPVSSSGHNFDSGTSCGFAAATDIADGGDPMLGALAANGGPTLTMLPLGGSPLANRVPLSDPGCAGVDQRGVGRPQGPGCDIGAVEGDEGDVVWAVSAGGAGSQLARNVRVDASGNSFVVGTITGSATFGSGAGAVTLVAQGAKDGFLAKYSPDGSLVWAKRIGGASSDEVWGLALDPSGAPVVTGVFDGTVSFGVLSTLSGINDMFVAKYSSLGNLSWVRAGSGPDWEQGLSVSVDGAGNVFVGGVYASASATFGPGQVLANQGSLDGFVARYGPGGGLWWVNSMAGPGQDFLTGVAARPDGSVAVTGTIDQSARFGVGGSFLPTAGSNDAFVGLFGPGGAPLWSTSVAGAGSDIGWSIATDAAGEIFVAGAFSGTASAGAHSAVSAGSLDVFVARFSGSGAALWMRGAGGAGPDFGLGVSVSGSDVYVTGSLMGAGTFGPFSVGTGNGLTPADGFLARLDTTGSWVWAQKLVTGPGTDYGIAVAATSAGVWATGNFVGASAVIGQGAGAQTITGAGSDDLFVTRFNR